MTNKNDPINARVYRTDINGGYNENNGITKREYIATHVLAGLSVMAIPDKTNSDSPEYNQWKAKHAVNLADELIKALNS